MIKAEVNVTGTIKKSAVVRTDKQGKPYIGFVLTTNLQNSQGETRSVDIYVNIPNGQQSELSHYIEGSRITVSGTMDVHRKDEDIVLFLEANLLSHENIGELDSISGIMSFRGHLRSEKVYEERTTKKGNPFLFFSAYSSEKVGEEFVSTWVNFMRFPVIDAGIETIKPEWMVGKAHVEIKGTFELQVFKGKLSIGSMVKEMNLYVKPENVQQ